MAGTAVGTLDIDPESASIQTHLHIIQNVIQRMAANSNACKAWCVALVSAMLVLSADKGIGSYVWVALIPVIVFWGLDVYYLALEKAFRKSYNDFVNKLHRTALTEKDLYFIEPDGNMSKLQIEAARSFSVWGFYGSLVVLICVAKSLMMA